MNDESTGAGEWAQGVHGEHRERYRDHDIVISTDRCRVQVDGQAYRFGRIGDLFYLEDYAYDPVESLVELVHRFIDYRDAASSGTTEAGE